MLRNNGTERSIIIAKEQASRAESPTLHGSKMTLARENVKILSKSIVPHDHMRVDSVVHVNAGEQGNAGNASNWGMPWNVAQLWWAVLRSSALSCPDNHLSEILPGVFLVDRLNWIMWQRTGRPWSKLGVLMNPLLRECEFPIKSKSTSVREEIFICIDPQLCLCDPINRLI